MIAIPVKKAFKKITKLPDDTNWFECQICYDLIAESHIKIHSKHHLQLQNIDFSVQHSNSTVVTK